MKAKHNWLKKGRQALALAAAEAFTALAGAQAVMASPAPDPDTVLGTLANNANANGDVTDIGNKILGIFRSGYDLVMTVGIALIVISLVWAAIKLIFSSGGNERTQGKNDVIRIVIAGVGLGAVLTLVSLMLKLGANLNA